MILLPKQEARDQLRRCAIPVFEFLCKNCDLKYEELTPYDKTNRYRRIICPECGSKKNIRLLSAATAVFSNPRGTSKEDSFSYKAGYNMELAKGERRQAEEKSHMGKSPYNNID